MGIDREKEYLIESYNISNREKYEQLRDRYQKAYDNNRSNSILAYIVKLQQCANGYEIDEQDKCVGYMDNGRNECLHKLLEKYQDQSTVIYFKYNEDLKELQKLGVPILSGATSEKAFNETLCKFNNKEIKLIALQQQLSLGFSLKSCDVMIYFSRKYGSILSAQSEDRACESTEKPLLIIDICAFNTIDEQIKQTINKQFSIINLFKKELHESK